MNVKMIEKEIPELTALRSMVVVYRIGLLVAVVGLGGNLMLTHIQSVPLSQIMATSTAWTSWTMLGLACLLVTPVIGVLTVGIIWIRQNRREPYGWLALALALTVPGLWLIR